MATALMSAAAHRPSMDRTASFDQPCSRSTPPFASPYDPPSPPHSRSGSSASNASPYGQPFAHNNYFPPQHPIYSAQQPHAWSTPALPSSAFHTPPYHGFPQQGYPQGFQQSPADFAAWANAYQHMMMASHHGAQGGITPPSSTEYPEQERRRTSSGPGAVARQQYGAGYFDGYGAAHHPPQAQQAPAPATQQHGKPQAQAFHPYKRGPQRVTSREHIPRSASMPTHQEQQTSGVPRSPSAPTALDAGAFPASTPTTLNPPTLEAQPQPPQQQREPVVSTLDSSAPEFIPPPKLGAGVRRDPSGSDRSARSAQSAQSAITRSDRQVSGGAARSGSPAPVRAPTPLHPGPIPNATNTPAGGASISGARPSPLGQAQNSHTPEPTDKMVKSGGLKGRLRKALDKDAKEQQLAAQQQQAQAQQQARYASPAKRSLPPNAFSSPSESSTRSATPPVTPPQHDLAAPSAPFTMHPSAMGSEISLAETERTATATEEGKGGKGKRSLFRMKNMSTDNISLSSTVSSASMMIRKMGSIGKLARRNSLMGISKIFKDKPKDEDAPIPEKEGKKKKDKKDKKKGKGKSDAAPAAVSHAVAESDRLADDDDRTLAGLTPAAKLARQHTLRSRAEAAKKVSDPATVAGGEGEAWDHYTAHGEAHVHAQPGAGQSYGSVVSAVPHGAGMSGAAPEVLRVQPRQTPTVVHAVAVTEHEYDSEDDSSEEGDTVEDVTMTMGKVRLSEEADAEFKATWGNAYIDRNAVPKRGILKATSSFSEDAAGQMSRQRSNSTQAGTSSGPGPLAQLPPSNPDRVDGLEHPTPCVDDPSYDPFSANFSPFDPPTTSSPDGIYQNPTHNTSAPALSLIGAGAKVGVQPRSMTAPARRRLLWAPECAVYSTYDAGTYDRRSEPATCNRLTPELAMSIKQELNAFKLEMPVHPSSRVYTHYFAW
ncbi:hypothetical protein IAT38_004201 [Cryptococcus sp. DSM 104549]